MRVLVVRNDKLGDLVLALPLVQRLKDAGHKVGVLVSAYTAPLLKNDSRLWAVVEDGPGVIGRLKALHFDAALVLWASPRNAWTVLRAGIGLRVGTRGTVLFAPFQPTAGPASQSRPMARKRIQRAFRPSH